MIALAERIAALATTPVAQLRAEWRRLHGGPPPVGLGSSLLARGIAYRLQEQALGALPASVARELERLAQQLDRSGDLDLERQARLKLGTRLVREWHGRTICVTVLEEGYLCDDRRYASLSQIARAVTGANWSGPRFFGLRPRKGTGAATVPEETAHG